MELAELERIIAKAKIDRVTKLDLSNQHLTMLPESIGNLKELTILKLGNNQLATLPESIGKLSKLNAATVDTWREYTLLKIDNIQAIYEDEDEDEPTGFEPMVLLKMTCPSTGHVHILRVPPEMTSAEAAITWINHGIHPDSIAIQT